MRTDFVGQAHARYVRAMSREDEYARLGQRLDAATEGRERAEATLALAVFEIRHFGFTQGGRI